MVASLILGLAAFCGFLGLGDAAEVVATNEWTLLGENDTIAAGMHVRMDLEKGERWVKLPEEDEDGSATVSVDGAVAVSETGTTDDEVVELQYDFEMMYRTLSQLPKEERDRMELPELPEGATVASLTGASREEFESRMKTIWEMRQEQLRTFEEENVADLPGILIARIQNIKEYLMDPYGSLVLLDLEAPSEEDNPRHIVAVLEDLEYLLTDVDMSRDFHTLGGWPLLASLLSDTVHQSSNHTLTQELTEKMHVLQSRAAWALGTAVKNTGEFSPFAVETIQVQNEKTTALDLLLQQMSACATDDSLVVRQKEQKLLYALGAMLRGNRRAQIHFGAESGPAVLGKRLEAALADGSPSALKLAKRVLTLAYDIVSDITLHPSTSEQVDLEIAKSFADEAWCVSVLKAFNFEGESTLQDMAALTARVLQDYCRWDEPASVARLQMAWSASDIEQDV